MSNKFTLGGNFGVWSLVLEFEFWNLRFVCYLVLVTCYLKKYSFNCLPDIPFNRLFPFIKPGPAHNFGLLAENF